ncbi:MAG: hypothetical protein H0Z37_04630 [Firmicutes bacterium]|nr:hypothetical protein [Bacillota bacterium]
MRGWTWGFLGFALGAYMMARSDYRTRRMWMRRARHMGRRLEKAARAVRSPGMKWIGNAVESLAAR